MNWYIKNIEKTYSDKSISGIADNGNLVNGKFEKIVPDARRGYVLMVKDSEGNIHPVKASNIRKIKTINKKEENTKEKNVKVNFCGMLYEGSAPEAKNNLVSTRIMTTKEPHTLKNVQIVVPSSHIVHEDK